MPILDIPDTGRLTFTLDWAADLAAPPRCGATLVSATWTLPTGITLISSSIAGSIVTPTIATTGLKVGRTYILVCRATLSNQDILPAAVEATAAYRATIRSTAPCPAP